MGNIDNTVQLTITKQKKSPGTDNFGKPCVFTSDTPLVAFSGGALTKLYTKASDVLTDFGSTSATYKMATAMKAQTKQVSSFYVATRSAAVSVIQEIGFSGALQATHTVTGTVNGEEVEVPYNTSDAQTLTDLATAIAAIEGISSATAITNGVRVTALSEWELTLSFDVTGSPAITTTISTTKKVDLIFSGALGAGDDIDGDVNGVAISTVTYATSDANTLALLATELETFTDSISSATAGTNKVTVIGIADTPLELENFVAAGGNNPTITPTTLVEPGRVIADDITDVLKENNSWYCFLTTSRNKGAALSAAKKLEGLVKMGLFQSNEAGLRTGSTSDLASRLKALSYTRAKTFSYYDNAIYSDGSWASRCLAVAPGSGTWAKKTLVDVTPEMLEDSEVAYLEGKNANYYIDDGLEGSTELGIMADGSYTDTLRNLDYLYTQIQSDMYQHIKNNEIVYYTQDGIDSCLAVLRGTLKRMQNENVLASFNVPDIDIADVTQTDKDNRILTNVTFTAEGTGAIQSVSIEGDVVLP